MLQLSLSLASFLSLACILFLSYIYIYLHKSSRHAAGGGLPPGPRPLPIIGSLHLLGPRPHRDVAALSKTYGPIFHLRLGSTPTIFISSPSLAEQVLKTHDVAFVNRPATEVAKVVSYGLKTFGFSDYGPFWRKLRWLAVNSLFTSSALQSFELIRGEEMENFVSSLKAAADERLEIDITAKVKELIADIACRVMIGRKCLDDTMDGVKFGAYVYELMALFGLFNISDALPFLRPLDLQGIRRKTLAIMEHIDPFLERVIDEHIELRQDGMKQLQHKDFVHTLLDAMNDDEYSDLKLDRTNIKAQLMEMFLGSLDSSPVAIDWALTELIRHPNAMKRAREELDRVVGRHRMVKDSDLSKLSYMGMVIKESLRLHSVGPFTFRRAREDVMLDGHKIPAGSSVMVSIWAIARDPDLWHNPEEFEPERFEGSGVDVKGHHFKLLPFGSGRRMCAGMSFALVVVPFVVAQLVHCFDWGLPDGMSPSELDMNEKYGFTMPRCAHLRATPTYRLVEVDGE